MFLRNLFNKHEYTNTNGHLAIKMYVIWVKNDNERWPVVAHFQNVQINDDLLLWPHRLDIVSNAKKEHTNTEFGETSEKQWRLGYKL